GMGVTCGQGFYMARPEPLDEYHRDLAMPRWFAGAGGLTGRESQAILGLGTGV
ncbi:MAG: hypothetical protein QOE44_2751, partial [Solirubrobacteraceae bacterium]|nr:hypothetical protein [Solirubrobacteraceae bacterium]